MLPRAIGDLFELVEERRAAGERVEVRCTFLEVYNEELFDLLDNGSPASTNAEASSTPRRASAWSASARLHQNDRHKGTAISIRETSAGGIYVAGAQEEICNSFSDLMWCLERGAARRATGSTLANTRSSRSHAIFTVLVEASPPGEHHHCRLSKLHMVDLAGSERSKRSQTTGMRFQEAIKINSGLLALSNVISALSTSKGKGRRSTSLAHIPYRDSRLTRMLQDSLGSNAHTCMIACVGPHDLTLEETLSTLKYAGRTRRIINMPIVNTSSRQEVERMRASLALSCAASIARRSVQKMVGVGASTAGPRASTRDRDPELLAAERALEAQRVSLVAAENRAAAAASKWADEREKLEDRLKRLETRCKALEGRRTEAMRARDGAIAERDALRERYEQHRRGISHVLAALDGEAINEDSERLAMLRRSLTDAGEVAHAEVDGDVSVAAFEEDASTALRVALVARDAEARQAEDSLKNALEDLERDERIFASKVEAISSLKSANAALRSENKMLLEQCASLRGCATVSPSHGVVVADEDASFLRASIQAEVVGTNAAAERIHALLTSPALEDDTDADAYSMHHASVLDESGMRNFDDAIATTAIPLGATQEVSKMPSVAVHLQAAATEAAAAVVAVDELESRVAQVEEEKRMLQAKVATAEKTAAAAQNAAAGVSAAHALDRAEMGRRLRTLQRQIKEKEERISALGSGATTTEGSLTSRSGRSDGLRTEMADRVAEVDGLRGALQSLDSREADRDDGEIRRMRLVYQEKIRKVKAQLSALQREVARKERIRAQKSKAADDAHVAAMRAETQRLRNEASSLKRRMQEAGERAEAQATAARDEAAAARRAAEEREREVRNLQRTIRHQQATMRRAGLETADSAEHGHLRKLSPASKRPTSAPVCQQSSATTPSSTPSRPRPLDAERHKALLLRDLEAVLIAMKRSQAVETERARARRFADERRDTEEKLRPLRLHLERQTLLHEDIAAQSDRALSIVQAQASKWAQERALARNRGDDDSAGRALVAQAGAEAAACALQTGTMTRASPHLRADQQMRTAMVADLEARVEALEAREETARAAAAAIEAEAENAGAPSLPEVEDALAKRLAGLHPEDIGGAVLRCLALISATHTRESAGTHLPGGSPSLLVGSTSTPSKVHRSLVSELDSLQDELAAASTRNGGDGVGTSRPRSASVRVSRQHLRQLSPEEVALRHSKARARIQRAVTPGTVDA